MDTDRKNVPLMLYESQARRLGISEAAIAAAKIAPQSCPLEWHCTEQKWMIYGLIPNTFHVKQHP